MLDMFSSLVKYTAQFTLQLAGFAPAVKVVPKEEPLYSVPTASTADSHISAPPPLRAPEESKSAPEPLSELQAIAQEKESAMGELTTQQDSGIAYLLAHYQAALTPLNLTTIQQKFCDFLKAEYAKNPIIDNGAILPFEYNAQLSPKQQALYHSHPIHTAYRYLFAIPNRWLSSKAVFIIEATQSSRIKMSDQQLICAIWLALNDLDFPLPAHYERTALKHIFVQEIAYIGRAHNWDKPAIYNAKTNTEKEFDDGDGDQPSCPRGVTRRLVQFLEILITEFAPQYRNLSAEIIKSLFDAELIAVGHPQALMTKIEAMTTGVHELSVALDQFVVEGHAIASVLPTNEETLVRSVFSFPRKSVAAFIEQMKARFGAERIMHAVEPAPRFRVDKFPSYQALIEHFAANAAEIFYDKLKLKLLCKHASLVPLPLEASAAEGALTEHNLYLSTPSGAKRKRRPEQIEPCATHGAQSENGIVMFKPIRACRRPSA